MKILLTNDDGIHAEGIQALIKAISQIAEVVVVAPDRERSASGHAITVHHPLRVEENKFGEIKGYAVDGTPSDCVKIAISALLEEPPDLVISGINRGPNLGTDVLYSGTVSAAIEGIIMNVPAIAMSLAAYENVDYTFAAEFAGKVAKSILQKPLPLNTILNINVPPLPKELIDGIAITKLGERKYENIFEKRKDPRGRTYYWLGGDVLECQCHTPEEISCDVSAIRNNMISITPIHFDLTDYRLIEKLMEWDFTL